MFHLVILGLTVTLGPCAEGFYFNEVYSVTAEYLGTPYTVRQWYDAVFEQSRMDINKGAVQEAYLLPSKAHPYGRIKKIVRRSTETHLNIKQCAIYDGSKRFPILVLKTILPSQDYFTFIGHEIVHGVNASKFYYPITVYFNNSITAKAGVYFWTTKKELHGKMEFVPLKQDYILHDFETGVYFYDSVVFSDYDTAPINSKTFEIDKEVRCEQVVQNSSAGIHDAFSDLPFPSHIFKLGHRLNQYRNEEELNMRQAIIERNRKMIEEHNSGDHSYKMAENHLIDRTEEEITRMCGRLPTEGPRKGQPFPYSDADLEALSADLPEEFDWRMYGVVTPVKDQGRCGSCWAFGAIGAVEGALFLQRNRTTLMTLSEQALVDCSWGFSNNGCSGGNEERAFEYMMKHGIPNDDRYGEYEMTASFCRKDKAPVETYIQAYYNIIQNETALKVALLKHGPITVAIHICRRMFFYSGGVFDDPNCKGVMNHVGTLVGYGVLEGKSYWIIKNSWGENWAASGYLLVAIKGNVCRVLDEASYVTLT